MEAVQLFMNKVGEGHHEDYMRAFFRLKLQDIGSLLPIVNDIVDRSTREITQNLADSVPQANEIILVSKTPHLRCPVMLIAAFFVRQSCNPHWTTAITTKAFMALNFPLSNHGPANQP